MVKQWVVNSSPIITLAKIGRVNLLPQLCDEMVIPNPAWLPPIQSGECHLPLQFGLWGIGAIRLGFGIISQGVVNGIQQGSYDDTAVTWILSQGQSFLKLIDSVDSAVAAWDLGLGESQVLSWALHHLGIKRSWMTGPLERQLLFCKTCSRYIKHHFAGQASWIYFFR
ncbi:MAG: hypothetical protein ACFCVD_03710 [Nodosilinea sp.]